MNIRKKLWDWIVLLLGIALIIAVTSCFFYEHSWFDGVHDLGWAHVHYILIVIGTGLIAWVAWVQLHHMREVGQNDFLLRIDNRYGGKEIVKARAIIQELYCSTKGEGDSISHDDHVGKIAQ